MAKITTKKPGSGGTPTLAEKQIVTAAEPLPGPKKLVETSAVPARNTPPVQPKSTPTPVKVTRTADIKGKPFSPPKAPNFVEPKKSKSGNLIVALGGVILIAVSLTKLNAGPKSYNNEFLPSDSVSREMLVGDDRTRLAMSAWKNEEPGFFGRIFQKLCLGYAKSYGCSTAPLHPLTKVAEQLGIQLRFDKEEDKKVIEQTIEYKSRAFTFNK